MYFLNNNYQENSYYDVICLERVHISSLGEKLTML